MARAARQRVQVRQKVRRAVKRSVDCGRVVFEGTRSVARQMDVECAWVVRGVALSARNAACHAEVVARMCSEVLQRQNDVVCVAEEESRNPGVHRKKQCLVFYRTQGACKR